MTTVGTFISPSRDMCSKSPVTGTTMTPSTLCWMTALRYFVNLSGFSSVLQRKTEYPSLWAASSTPRATVVQKVLVISGRIKASVYVSFERRLLAARLRTYPSSSIAFSTFARVPGLTLSSLFTTRETVIGETPADFATSRIVVIMRFPGECVKFWLNGNDTIIALPVICVKPSS